MDYENYMVDMAADIAHLISDKACQPILFVGAGFSKRYCGAPNWDELLTQLAVDCPEVKHEYAYFRQSKLSMPAVGSVFSKAYKEWAWGAGRKFFPDEFFKPEVQEDIFIKYAIAKKLKDLGPNDGGSFGSAELDAEIEGIKRINPHAVITTNYDKVLEQIFTDYAPVIGQQVIRHSYLSIGEVFKIHGCISEPSSLTLTQEDYDKFANDKKYLSAKLFTYFVEHPLLFVGYSAADENIKSILQEIDHMLPTGVGLVDNIYILEWKNDLDLKAYPARDKVIDVGGGRTIRIKSITANSFKWVFDAFRSEAALEKVNIKLLRSITHRVVDLVRKDAAKNVVEINFEMLSHALAHPNDFAKVFGIAAMSDPALMNVMYPYSPTKAAKEFGYKGWNQLYKLIEVLKNTTGYDIRASDNHFHVQIPSGESGHITKFSQAAVDLLMKVRDGQELPDLNDQNITGEKLKPVAV